MTRTLTEKQKQVLFTHGLSPEGEETIVVSARFLKSEVAQIEKTAKRLGLRRAEYIRQLVCGRLAGIETPVEPDEAEELTIDVQDAYEEAESEPAYEDEQILIEFDEEDEVEAEPEYFDWASAFKPFEPILDKQCEGWELSEDDRFFCPLFYKKGFSKQRHQLSGQAWRANLPEGFIEAYETGVQKSLLSKSELDFDSFGMQRTRVYAIAEDVVDGMPYYDEWFCQSWEDEGFTLEYLTYRCFGNGKEKLVPKREDDEWIPYVHQDYCYIFDFAFEKWDVWGEERPENPGLVDERLQLLGTLTLNNVGQKAIQTVPIGLQTSQALNDRERFRFTPDGTVMYTDTVWVKLVLITNNFWCCVSDVRKRYEKDDRASLEWLLDNYLSDIGKCLSVSVTCTFGKLRDMN